MKLVWLRPDEVDREWPEIAPLFQRVIDKAVKGEYALSDVYEMAIKGDATVGVARENGEIIMALAFQFAHYPKKMGVNVLGMGGKRLMEFMKKFMPPFVAFCRKAGADWIECSVSPGMERMHLRSGFETVYRIMRYDLTEEKANDHIQ